MEVLMNKLKCNQFQLGRHFTGKLPHGCDLITSIENFCKEKLIQTATFSLIGAVSSATLGIYDQKQQVYVSFKKDKPFEIISCTGNVSLVEGTPMIHAHILLADEQGETVGGHLFSETVIYAGEIDIQELKGDSLERVYDETTGLMLWKL